jgi:hypothetical protein
MVMRRGVVAMVEFCRGALLPGIAAVHISSLPLEDDAHAAPPSTSAEAKGRYALVWFGIRRDWTDPESSIAAGGITNHDHDRQTD